MRVVHRPAVASSVIAVLAAVASVVAVASVSEQYLAAGVTLAGMVVLGVGAAVAHRGYRLLGVPIAAVGVAVGFAGFGLGVSLVGDYGRSFTYTGELIGLLGVPFVALGVVPLHRRVARRLVSLGFAVLVIGVVFTGAVNGSGTNPVPLLAGMVAAVVAWDAGEQAINLGNQLGRAARTWPAELSHSGGTAVFGGLSVGAGLATFGMDVTGLPLESLLLLLGAALVLMVALYK